MLPPQMMTPIFPTSGHRAMISLVLNTAAATEAPAEASITSFILLATNFIASFISSSVMVRTSVSMSSQSIGKVRCPVYKSVIMYCFHQIGKLAHLLGHYSLGYGIDELRRV